MHYNEKDFILKKDVDFFGRNISKGTVFKKINADYYHPIIDGNQCPSCQLDFYTVKKNPEYFVPYSNDLKDAFGHIRRCEKALNLLEKEDGDEWAVQIKIKGLSMHICDNISLLPKLLENEINQAYKFIRGEPDSKF